jgi:hypothetical protein
VARFFASLSSLAQNEPTGFSESAAAASQADRGVRERARGAQSADG